jgi:environmental stress-induced protein Ves
MKIIRRSAFSAAAWKNGGGITHEAIRVPASGDRFLWRVSVAHIEAAGPFSDFSGYRRIMVLLRGAGLRLGFVNGAALTLRHVGDLVDFDGALAAQCELLAGPCIDFNFIVSQSIPVTDAGVRRLTEALAPTPRPGDALVVFPVDGQVTVQARGAPAATLEPWDLAVIPPASAASILIALAQGDTASQVFVASFADAV